MTDDTTWMHDKGLDWLTARSMSRAAGLEDCGEAWLTAMHDRDRAERDAEYWRERAEEAEAREYGHWGD